MCVFFPARQERGGLDRLSFLKNFHIRIVMIINNVYSAVTHFNAY